MFTITPLFIIYALLLLALIYVPGHPSKLRDAMNWWWFRFAFILTVVYLVTHVDSVLGLLVAALFVLLNPTQSSSRESE